MPQLRVWVDLSRHDPAAVTVVLEVRLQGNVVFGVVVAPLGGHRGCRVRLQRHLPERIPTRNEAPRRQEG